MNGSCLTNSPSCPTFHPTVSLGFSLSVPRAIPPLLYLRCYLYLIKEYTLAPRHPPYSSSGIGASSLRKASHSIASRLFCSLTAFFYTLLVYGFTVAAMLRRCALSHGPAERFFQYVAQNFVKEAAKSSVVEDTARRAALATRNVSGEKVGLWVGAVMKEVSEDMRQLLGQSSPSNPEENSKPPAAQTDEKQRSRSAGNPKK